MSAAAIEPIVCGRTVHSLDRAVLADVCGTPLADVGQAPRLMAAGALAQARRAADGRPVEHALLVRAAELFANAELDGETPDEYERRVALGTGLPRGTVRHATADIVRAIDRLPRTVAAELPATEQGSGYRTSGCRPGGSSRP